LAQCRVILFFCPIPDPGFVSEPDLYRGRLDALLLCDLCHDPKFAHNAFKHAAELLALSRSRLRYAVDRSSVHVSQDASLGASHSSEAADPNHRTGRRFDQRKAYLNFYLLLTMDITRQQLSDVAADREANWLPPSKGAFKLTMVALRAEARRRDREMEPAASNEASRANTR
jgi:hypothetical protein